MSCGAKTCISRSLNDSLINCGLCDLVIHAKCIGLPGRLVDFVVDHSKGVFWYCIKCRHILAAKHNLIGSLGACIKKLRTEISAIQDHFNLVETLFNDLDSIKSPSLVSSSPSPKRKQSKKVISPKILSPVKVSSPKAKAKTNSPCKNEINIKEVKTSLEKIKKSTLAPEKSAQSDGVAIDSSVSSAQPMIVDNGALDNEPLSSAHSASSSSAESTKIVSSLLINSQEPAETASFTNLLKNSHSSSTSANPPSILEVVPKRKAIFISRLVASTSTDDIANYVKAKLTNVNFEQLSVRKFSVGAGRNFASFNILAPDEYFDSLLHKSFWPSGTFVKIFKPRAKKPSKLPSIPKN